MKSLEFKLFCRNICIYKVQLLIEMLSRKVEGIDPAKP